MAAPNAAKRISLSREAAPERSENGLEELLRVGNAPQNSAGSDDIGLFQGEEFAHRRNEDKQAIIEPGHAMKWLFELQSRNLDDPYRIAECRDHRIFAGIDREEAEGA